MPLPAEVRRPFMLATSLWNGSGGRPRRGLRAGVPGVYRGGGLPERELHHIAAPTTRLAPPSRPGTARAPLRRDLSPGTGGCKLLPVARASVVASGAPVAQRIEHLTTDQKVVGSNPIGRTPSGPRIHRMRGPCVNRRPAGAARIEDSLTSPRTCPARSTAIVAAVLAVALAGCGAPGTSAPSSDAPTASCLLYTSPSPRD